MVNNLYTAVSKYMCGTSSTGKGAQPGWYKLLKLLGGKEINQTNEINLVSPLARIAASRRSFGHLRERGCLEWTHKAWGHALTIPPQAC